LTASADVGSARLPGGAVYPALARVERGELVATYHVPSDRGSARKYYRLSEAGRDELRARVDAWHLLADVVEHFTKGIQL
jgi:PadR family transcriptional regulator PadR